MGQLLPGRTRVVEGGGTIASSHRFRPKLGAAGFMHAPLASLADNPTGDPQPRRAVEAGRSVLATEIKGLQALSETLDGAFNQVVALILSLRGRLIVTGMGKSGHIARKIAATFASTGTLAYFVHPGEASHGDLGMISKEDAVLALSNSGETSELNDILHYCRRNGIPLVAMTSRLGSALAETADLVLLLPNVREACAIGMAPTTSTTMMIALGDALAVAVMEQKGFTTEHFHNFHPGGRLGQTLLRVSKIMHAGASLPIVRADQPMAEVILEITAKSFGCAAVVDDTGRLIGAVTDGDLRRHMHDLLLRLSAADVMTGQPKAITGELLVGEAVALMNQHKITSLFVCEDGRPVGLVHIHDCLRAGVA